MPILNLKTKSNVELVRRDMENLRGSYKKIGKYRISETVAEIKRRMKTPGKKIKYPVNWASLIQKLAFFASDGFGGGIPTVRRGTYERGLKAESTLNGAKVYNNTPGAKFIGGNMRGQRQSPIHKGRWLLLRNVYDVVIKRLPKSVVESLRKLPKRA